MVQSEFERCVKKLVDCYGVKQYPAERVKRFWYLFGRTDGALFEKAIDKIIGSQSRAPMSDDIEKAISEVREFNYHQIKKKDRNLPLAEIQEDDLRVYMQRILDRMNRVISDEEWAFVVQTMREAYPFRFVCMLCRDSGFLFTESSDRYEHVFRCECKFGEMKSEGYPVWNRLDFKDYVPKFQKVSE